MPPIARDFRRSAAPSPPRGPRARRPGFPGEVGDWLVGLVWPDRPGLLWLAITLWMFVVVVAMWWLYRGVIGVRRLAVACYLLLLWRSVHGVIGRRY